MVNPKHCPSGCDAPCLLRHGNFNNDFYHYYFQTRNYVHWCSDNICHRCNNQTYQHINNASGNWWDKLGTRNTAAQ